MTEPGIRLSVVVVCKNEEGNIARCLDSVFAALAGLEGYEVLVTDSASTDRTVEIASGYPVKLVLLREEWHLSPSAGRHSGFMHSRGEFVAFIDGDMEVDEGWFSFALSELAADERLAGMTGLENRMFMLGEEVVGVQPNEYGVPSIPSAVRVLAGSAVFRRDALEKAGDFNPYLFSEEEAELCYRLTKAGYELRAYPEKMVTHHCLPRSSWSEIVRRFRNRLYIGLGQVLRISIRHGLFWQHLWRFRLFLGYMLFLGTGLIVLFLNWKQGVVLPLLSWVGVLLVALAAFVVKKRSIREVCISLTAWTLISASMIRGFLMRPSDPKGYPLAESRASGTGANLSDPPD